MDSDWVVFSLGGRALIERPAVDEVKKDMGRMDPVEEGALRLVFELELEDEEVCDLGVSPAERGLKYIPSIV